MSKNHYKKNNQSMNSILQPLINRQELSMQHGMTGLMQVVNNCDDVGQVERLLKIGGSLDECSKKEGGLIAIALKNGHKKVAKWLIDNGAPLDPQDANGETALIIATRKAYNDIVRILLEHRADYTIKDKEGHTAGYYAARDDLSDIGDIISSYEDPWGLQGCLKYVCCCLYNH